MIVSVAGLSIFISRSPVFLHTVTHMEESPAARVVVQDIAELAAGVCAAAASRRPNKRQRVLNKYRKADRVKMPVPDEFTRKVTLKYAHLRHPLAACGPVRSAVDPPCTYRVLMEVLRVLSFSGITALHTILQLHSLLI